MANEMTSREFRDVASEGFITDRKYPSNFAKVPPGKYGPHITVAEDGSVLVSPKAYADDVAAFLLGCIAGHPGIDASVKAPLALFVDAMDKRAVDIHGYSDSPAERDYKRVGATKRLAKKVASL